MPAPAKRNTQIKLSKSLVLNRWVLSQFGVDALESLADIEFKRSVYEGLDADNKTHFHSYLYGRQHTFPGVTKSQLIAWDQNIVSHTLAISEKRDAPIKWKYFQYLTLLFTELYLECFFGNRKALLEGLNEYVEKWNDPFNQTVRNASNFICEPFVETDLNKLAYWCATGSGKTLMMHVNILQYRHYMRFSESKTNLNKIILVTPNEGLSTQHLKEFVESGIEAELFSKRSGSIFSGRVVEVIEISKLAEESGDKTVAVEAFETNNLVLIDEGHRGVAGEQWKERRDLLSKTGFAFEYSATFGQAVAAATGAKRLSLTQEYSKTILMDYSYKYFYTDGYGKDYHILNVPQNDRSEFIRKYLTGALLAYYQQHCIFEENPLWASTFNLHKPLWVFVGGSVNAVRTVAKEETSDVLDIIKFFREFIQDPILSRQHLQELLSGRDGILDRQNRSVFTGRFNYLTRRALPIQDLYFDILKKVFHTDTIGANIYIDQLKGQDGELGIRVGDNYFGVINVGDETKLFKLCQEKGIEGESKDFSSSLFHKINEKDSRINLLIGAKKFTEGWSSWRVSTMGLMNIGRSEGSQIIQLFGRGVRLKGYRMSLKRTSMLDQDQRPVMKLPKEITPVETLQIFGIRADYMQQFKEFLEEEGLPANDSVFTQIEMPVMITTNLGTIRLKVLQVQEGVDFKKEEVVNLIYCQDVGRESVKLQWFPRVQMMSGNRNLQNIVPVAQEYKLQEKHLAFIDWQRVYFALQQFKNERSWYNLSIEPKVLQDIIRVSSWYVLSIPEGELEPNTFRKVMEWEEIVIALLKGYTERYYNIVKAGYLSDRMETVELTPDHPNFIDVYRIEIENSKQNIIDKITQINGALRSLEFNDDVVVDHSFTVFNFLDHLYKPLIYIDADKYKDIVKISPVALNKGEYQFINHLKQYYEQEQEFFVNRKLFLLRNMSRKGIGFFEANGFYPDFILWLIEKGRQYITFIDPKGLRQVNGFENPKLRFYKTVKEKIETRVREKDPDVTLNAFIVSPTPFDDVSHWSGGESISSFNERNVFFMNEQNDVYVRMMLAKVVGENSRML